MNIRIRVVDGHGGEWFFIRPIGQADINGRCFIGAAWASRQEMLTDEPANNTPEGVGGFDDWVAELESEVNNG